MRLVWAGQLELELGISFTPKKSQLRVDMQGQGTWDKGHDLYTIDTLYLKTLDLKL